MLGRIADHESVGQWSFLARTGHRVESGNHVPKRRNRDRELCRQLLVVRRGSPDHLQRHQSSAAGLKRGPHVTTELLFGTHARSTSGRSATNDADIAERPLRLGTQRLDREIAAASRQVWIGLISA